MLSWLVNKYRTVRKHIQIWTLFSQPFYNINQLTRCHFHCSHEGLLKWWEHCQRMIFLGIFSFCGRVTQGPLSDYCPGYFQPGAIILEIWSFLEFTSCLSNIFLVFDRPGHAFHFSFNYKRYCLVLALNSYVFNAAWKVSGRNLRSDSSKSDHSP